jgi:hypothetical protein
MSFGIEPKKLKSLVDLYYPNNHGEELRYMIHLKGEEELFRSKSFINQILKHVRSKESQPTPSRTGSQLSERTLLNPGKHRC